MSHSKGPKVQRLTGLRGAGQTDPNRTEVRLARLCFQMLKTSRWSSRFAGGKDVFTQIHIYALTHLHIYTRMREYVNVRFYNPDGR